MAHINRYMIRCCYCKQTFAVENPTSRQGDRTFAHAIVSAHAETCPKTAQRLTFRAYGRTDRQSLHMAAYDVLTADYRINQVRGTYSADVRCSAKCTHAKGGDCQCECGGKNHGSGLVLTTYQIAS